MDILAKTTKLMDKKMTVGLGIALGVSLLAGAGYGVYRYFSGRKKSTAGEPNGGLGSAVLGNRFGSGYIGRSLIKSNSLIDGGYDTELTGGGLYRLTTGRG